MRRAIVVGLAFALLLATMVVYALYCEPVPEHPSTPIGAFSCDTAGRLPCDGGR